MSGDYVYTEHHDQEPGRAADRHATTLRMREATSVYFKLYLVIAPSEIWRLGFVTVD